MNQFFSQLLKSKILNCWFSIFHQFEKTSRPRVWDKIGKSKKYEGFYSGFLWWKKNVSMTWLLTHLYLWVISRLSTVGRLWVYPNHFCQMERRWMSEHSSSEDKKCSTPILLATWPVARWLEHKDSDFSFRINVRWENGY